MQYAQLGDSGLTVSRMALGTMTFGHYSFASFHANVNEDAAERMVGLALDAGVNLFDTAEGYGNGQSEEVLGAALRRLGARDRAVRHEGQHLRVKSAGPRRAAAELPPRSRQRRAGAATSRDRLDRSLPAARARLRDPLGGDAARAR
jgi:aryl-alcohol dehydrogenase-like predicted oxidoreductase